MADTDLQDIQDAIKARKDQLDLSPIDKPQTKLENLTANTKFTDVVDEAKIKTLQEASVNDPKFTEDFKNKLKEATLKAAELEKQKQELENRYVELQQNYLKTKQEFESQIQKQNAWANKEKSRQYHYNGLKDIMEFINIKNPMNVVLMYILAIISSPLYLVWTLLINPVWSIVSGKLDKDRPLFIKWAVWILALVIMLGLAAAMFYAIGRFKFGWWK